MKPATQVPHGTATMTKGMVLLFAFCCGAIVANIYYAQPIIGLIAPDIGLTSTMPRVIVAVPWGTGVAGFITGLAEQKRMRAG